MNKVVTIAAAKGGVTKTTSSMYLAASAVRKDPDARVRVMATDPQSCAAHWALEAEESGSPLPFEVVDAKLLDVERLAGDGFEGLTIIDTPPADPITVAAVEAADFVVVPCTDTELDLQQTWRHPQGPPGQGTGAVLLCHVGPHTRLFKAVSDALATQQTQRFDAVIRKHQAIKACMGRPLASCTSMRKRTGSWKNYWKGSRHERPTHIPGGVPGGRVRGLSGVQLPVRPVPGLAVEVGGRPALDFITAVGRVVINVLAIAGLVYGEYLHFTGRLF